MRESEVAPWNVASSMQPSVSANVISRMLGISAVSLCKYEYGERTPKDPMIAEIARCLEVNPSSLKSDWGSDANDAIHMLFELEEAFCLEPTKVGETIVLALPEDLGSDDQEALAKALRHWYRNNRDLKDDELTRDEYVAWKDSFKA